MVLPEGSPSSQSARRASPGLAGVAIAVLLLFGSTVVLGEATAPSEEDAAGGSSTTTTAIAPLLVPTTSTTIDLETFSVEDIATGDEFAWIEAPTLGEVWPIDLVQHRGRVYLFGSDEWSESRGAGMGLRGWVSTDGIGWNPLGEVIGGEHLVFEVVSVGDELVALAARLDDGAPVLWTSSEGASWSSLALPLAPGAEPGVFHRLNAVIEFDGRLIVAGVMSTDALERVVRALPPELVGSDPSSVDIGFRLPPSGGVVEVYGPLGLHGFTIRLDDLGLDQLTERDLLGPRPPGRQFLWTSTGPGSWEVESFESSIVDEIWLRPDGTLVAHGVGARQTTVSVSRDGETWEKEARSSRAWIFRIGARAIWGDTLVGGGLGENLFFSSDGLAWDYAGTGAMLPDAINWRLGPVAAGDGGLAAVATALTHNPGPRFSQVIVEEAGSVLTLDVEAGGLSVDTPDAKTVTIPLWATNTGDKVDIDFVEELVTFKSPQTGESLVRVDFATLNRAEASALSYRAESERGLLFTTNGSQWSLQDLTGLIGGTHAIAEMVVLDDRLIAVSSPADALHTTAETPEIAVWVGFLR